MIHLLLQGFQISCGCVYYVNEIASEALWKCYKRIDPMHEYISEISTVIAMVAYNNVTTTSSDASETKLEEEKKKNSNLIPRTVVRDWSTSSTILPGFRNGLLTLIRRLTR